MSIRTLRGVFCCEDVERKIHPLEDSTDEVKPSSSYTRSYSPNHISTEEDVTLNSEPADITSARFKARNFRPICSSTLLLFVLCPISFCWIFSHGMSSIGSGYRETNKSGVTDQLDNITDNIVEIFCSKSISLY